MVDQGGGTIVDQGGPLWWFKEATMVGQGGEHYG